MCFQKHFKKSAELIKSIICLPPPKESTHAAREKPHPVGPVITLSSSSL